MDETLRPDDAGKVLEELLDAQNHAHLLGLMMNVKPRDVEAIQTTYQQPKDRLLHIIIAFLQQAEPRPTWRAIVNALKSPVVGLTALARRVEADHFPETTATCDVVAETTTKPVAKITAGDDEVKSKPSSQLSSTTVTESSAVAALQEEIKRFHRRFNSMKSATIACLEKCCISVMWVVFLLTSALGENKAFLEQKYKDLGESSGHWELFQGLNLYLNYLSFGLLDGLIDDLSESNSAFGNIKVEMNQYKEDIQKFRENTKLALFCQLDYSMLAINQLQPCEPPPGFQKMVTEHQWPETVTLKDVEEFRKEFLLGFGLPECAMMVNRIRRNCFEITWFVLLPPSVIRSLRNGKVQIELVQDFQIISVELDGKCVYQSPTEIAILSPKVHPVIESPVKPLPFYKSQVSGPGLTSATVNHPTHILVELTDSSGRPCSPPLNVTAQLELVSKATPTSEPEATPIRIKQPVQHISVAKTSPSHFEVLYTPASRGQHKLHVQVNNREINGSPLTITVYPDPRQLGLPVRTVTGLTLPCGIVINSHQEMIVSELQGHRLSVFDIRGQKIRTFGSRGDSADQMKCPAGIATDDMDDIYVSSQHKLQKFTSGGKLIKCIGQEGRKEGEFDCPRGVTLYHNQVFVCDSHNHRIQMFDLDLNFVQSIGAHGKGRGELNAPLDVKFDTAGNMYVAEYGNERVQVLDTSGKFIRTLCQEGEGKLGRPSGLHIVDKYVYVSDFSDHCIVVYETSGQFVTSFGRYGQNEGEFRSPYYITSCVDGFIYICDFSNCRVQIF